MKHKHLDENVANNFLSSKDHPNVSLSKAKKGLKKEKKTSSKKQHPDYREVLTCVGAMIMFLSKRQNTSPSSSYYLHHQENDSEQFSKNHG